MTAEARPATPTLTDQEAEKQAQLIIADFVTSYRNNDPVPAIGNTPPVTQPGRPPMSQRAVDTSTIMLSASAATIPPGAIAIGVMLASGYADPAVIGMICAAPAVIAVPIIAVARLMRAARPEPEIHHHYNGTVHQDQRRQTSKNIGVWARGDNRQ